MELIRKKIIFRLILNKELERMETIYSHSSTPITDSNATNDDAEETGDDDDS